MATIPLIQVANGVRTRRSAKVRTKNGETIVAMHFLTGLHELADVVEQTTGWTEVCGVSFSGRLLGILPRGAQNFD